jgi:hypothetical protein
MLTQRDRAELLAALMELAKKMTDDDLIDTVGFVRDSVRDNPRQDTTMPLRQVYPEPLVARR